MTEYITLLNGTASWTIRLENIHEWPIVSWRAAMRHMIKGGDFNLRAVAELSEWFPEAARTACVELRGARETFERLYRDPKTLPRRERALCHSVNAELRRAVRQAQNKYDKLAARHHEFLAAKAQMKKEN